MAKGGGGEQPQQPSGDHSLDFLWVVVAIIIALMLVWHYQKDAIAEGICFVRSYELKTIEFVFRPLTNLLNIAPFETLKSLQPNLATFNKWQEYCAAKQTGTKFSTLMELATYVGSFIRYPIVLIMLILAAYLYFSSAVQRFKTIYNMSEFRRLEQKNWPQISPVIKENLINTDLDKGPWAVALSPLPFCKKYNLVREEKDENGKPFVTLIRGAAYRTLFLQLGPRWNGPHSLPKHQQALLAVFVSRINDDKKSADALILQLATSAASGRLNYSGVISLLNKNLNTKAVAKIISAHAYVTTVMASLLAASREAGVIATAEFIWLKAIDRRMWYMLNSVGRPTAVAEICGTFAHWLAEKKLGIPLCIPMIDEAVNGLELALKEILYKPEDS